FQAEDGIRDATVTGVQTCALPIYGRLGVGYQLPRARRGRSAHRQIPERGGAQPHFRSAAAASLGGCDLRPCVREIFALENVVTLLTATLRVARIRFPSENSKHYWTCREIQLAPPNPVQPTCG